MQIVWMSAKLQMMVSEFEGAKAQQHRLRQAIGTCRIG